MLAMFWTRTLIHRLWEILLFFVLILPSESLAEERRSALQPEMRVRISLNGTWQAAGASSPAEIPNRWPARIPVPGLADQAVPPVAGDYVYYRKMVDVPLHLPTFARLEIEKGFYGKALWVNGRKVGEHQPNFTPASFDVSSYLKRGVANEIVVRVGQRGTQPPGHGTGLDYEKQSYIPGLYDDVSLVFSGEHRVEWVQTAPLSGLASVKVLAHLQNQGEHAATFPVSFRLFERSSGRLRSEAIVQVTLAAHENNVVEKRLEVESPQPWTPETPFLYDLRVATDDDDTVESLGLRTFGFDATTRKPLLNGSIFMLRGTNVTIFRFFEDAERGSLPWNEEWIRRFFRLHKQMNMNSARFAIGFPPEIWYRVADEEGFLITDEYPLWRTFDGLEAGVTEETLTAEARDWVRARHNHPSVIMWDMANETLHEATGRVIRAVRGWDLQNRPWDNGWGEPQAPTDTRELHLYWNQPFPGGAVGPSWTTAVPWTTEDLERESLWDQHAIPENPVALNEYAWIWLTREGLPTLVTRDTFAQVLPGASAEERLVYRATQVAQETEWFRANRAAIVQQFAALGYSRPEGGVTADNFLPGLDKLTLSPLFRELMTQAMAPVGLMLGYWRRGESLGNAVEIPVTVVNDRPFPYSGEVTLRLMEKERVVREWRERFVGVPTGYRQEKKFAVEFPAVPGDYDLVAELHDGESAVRSSRRVRVDSDHDVHGWARGRPVQVKSASPAYGASQLNDGFNSTRWSSRFVPQSGKAEDWEWVVIDLGSERAITRVRLLWEFAYAREYDIAVSNDFETWTTLFATSLGDGGLDELTNLQGSGRYVRLQCKRSAINQGSVGNYSLYEFQVW